MSMSFASTRRAKPALALLTLALLAALSLPAMAAEPGCINPDGTPKAGSTDQGQENAGGENATCDIYASAFGWQNNASGWDSNAFGEGNHASGYFSSAFGSGNNASGDNSSAFGYRNTASGNRSSAFGYSSTASGYYSSAFGFNNTASLSYDSAFGAGNTASGGSSSAFGYSNVASGSHSSAFGSSSAARGDQSTALGYLAVANEDDVVSFGHATGDLDNSGNPYGSDRNVRLIHVAEGLNGWDAANVNQLNALVGWMGGGAAILGGAFTAPTFTIQGTDYHSVGAALAAIDGWMTVNSGGVQYDDPSHSSVTLDGASGTTIGNVADGVDAHDAANVGQMQAGDAATLASANSYTDTKSAQTLTAANTYTDQRFATWNDTFTQYKQQVDIRFAQTDRRIDRVGAMGSALSAAALNTAGLPGANRVGVGVGVQNGRSAMAIQYQHLVRPNASVSLGGSISGGESSIAAGAGFSW
ncbi:YadA-like family protein [Thermomonas sp.]|uniref:YadA-like family protein n=1 Tax=Thermomonas sp. TaxID=1971895 RepID=UPI00262D4C01|nr:YadA-like family protein [Thermomonas sp.]